jgi:large subunit ribosomal protein L25
MSEVVINAEIRANTGKHAKYSRSQGMVPGVYYARGEENINVQVPVLQLNQLVFTSETHVIDLQLGDGSSRKCILRDVQFDPVSDRPVHFDLQGLKENEKLTIEIPVTMTGGIPKGVRDGGMLQQFLHRVRVSCLPKDIPEKIEINVGDLGINSFVHIRDINVANVTLVDNAENAVIGVLPPHVVKEEEVAPVVEEAAKEPEVVGKGKKPEDGEEGAAPAEKKGGAPAEKKGGTPADKKGGAAAEKKGEK